MMMVHRGIAAGDVSYSACSMEAHAVQPVLVTVSACRVRACVRVSMAMQSPTPHTSSVATRRLAGTDGCGQRYALQLQYAYDMMQQALIDDHERVPRSNIAHDVFCPPSSSMCTCV